MRADDFLYPTHGGLYCPAGDFFIDPVRPVPRALITHGHGDHARAGALRGVGGPLVEPELAVRHHRHPDAAHL